MLKLGFAVQWVERVMKCVSTVSYRIKVNGDYSNKIYPQRGLRQGDPLSPLFLLCAEGLSALLPKAEEGRIEGIRVCREAPRINHLFFADDSQILMRAYNGDAQELKRILQVYETGSGQVINRENLLSCSVQILALLAKRR